MNARRRLIRAVWLLPLFCGLMLLIPFLVPHAFFLQDGSLTGNFSLFDLLASVHAQARAVLTATDLVEPSSYSLALLMRVLTVAS